MRDIKFRAWDGKQLYPVAILGIWENFSYGQSRSWMHNSMDWDEEDLFTQGPILMQFTGLKDKNGKEIYEGDIVRHDRFDGALYVCEFEDGQFTFREYHEVLGKSDCYRMGNEELSKHGEVIGNIHENGELLK